MCAVGQTIRIRADCAESSIHHSSTVAAALGGLKGITAFKRETLLHNSLKCVWLGFECEFEFRKAFKLKWMREM